MATAQVAAAQPRADATSQRGEPAAERRILLLRAEETPARGAAAEVERSLRRALQELGFVVMLSPLPLRDAQLAAGCEGTIRQCGASVAQAAQGELLAVSVLELAEGARAASLRLYSFAPSGQVREAAGEVPLASPAQLDGAVRALVQAVYAASAPDEALASGRATRTRLGRAHEPGSPDPAALPPAQGPARGAQPARPAAMHRDPVLWAAGWTTTGLGGALLIGGVASQLAAGSDSARSPWTGAGRRDAPEAELAGDERAERRADAARVLYGAGGALLLTGATLLVVGRLSAQRDSSLQASVLPLRHGAALSFAGSFGGDWP